MTHSLARAQVEQSDIPAGQSRRTLTSAQQRGRIGGITNAALAASPQAITAAARSARWQRYVDQVREARPEITDEAELIRRAELLRRADMTRLSLKAAKARRLRAEARALEAELDASGLEDAGSDGADLDD